MVWHTCSNTVGDDLGFDDCALQWRRMARNAIVCDYSRMAGWVCGQDTVWRPMGLPPIHTSPPSRSIPRRRPREGGRRRGACRQAGPWSVPDGACDREQQRGPGQGRGCGDDGCAHLLYLPSGLAVTPAAYAAIISAPIVARISQPASSAAARSLPVLTRFPCAAASMLSTRRTGTCACLCVLP